MLDLDEYEIQELYAWIDAATFSRPKRNITRDFSDGVACAELVHSYLPKIIEMHNYSPANSVSQKMYNWHTLNNKAFKKIGYSTSIEIMSCIVNMKPGYIEYLLWDLKQKIDYYRSISKSPILSNSGDPHQTSNSQQQQPQIPSLLKEKFKQDQSSERLLSIQRKANQQAAAHNILQKQQRDHHLALVKEHQIRAGGRKNHGNHKATTAGAANPVAGNVLKGGVTNGSSHSIQNFGFHQQANEGEGQMNYNQFSLHQQQQQQQQPFSEQMLQQAYIPAMMSTPSPAPPPVLSSLINSSKLQQSHQQQQQQQEVQQQQLQKQQQQQQQLLLQQQQQQMQQFQQMQMFQMQGSYPPAPSGYFNDGGMVIDHQVAQQQQQQPQSYQSSPSYQYPQGVNIGNVGSSRYTYQPQSQPQTQQAQGQGQGPQASKAVNFSSKLSQQPPPPSSSSPNATTSPMITDSQTGPPSTDGAILQQTILSLQMKMMKMEELLSLKEERIQKLSASTEKLNTFGVGNGNGGMAMSVGGNNRRKK